ncbi:MAG: hypothetical protein AAF490_32345 [Chloroflexota bacterium]
MNPTNKQTCPDCNRQLFFSGNGRSLICEYCGFQKPIERPNPSVKDLEHAQRLRSQYGHLEDADGRSEARIRVAEGKQLVLNGRLNDAYDALSWVLKHQSSDIERANAWYWLSHVFEDIEEKRVCLQHAISLAPNLGFAHRDLAVLEGRLNPDEIVDPDKVQESRALGLVTAVVNKHACPRCDAGMHFDSHSQKYSCAFCGLTQTVAEQEASEKNGRFGQGQFEQEFMTALSTAKGHLKPVNLRHLQCSSCATDFMLAPETMSLTCPYCESVFVTDTAESIEIMPPHAIIPFAVSLDDAEIVLRNWLKKQKIAPQSNSPLNGVYHPLWTFDIGGEVKWRGFVEKNDQWVPVSSSRLVFFDDVLVPGNRHISKQLLQNFKAFDLSKIEQYDDRFLANWPAERYTFPLADASLNGRKRMLKQLRKKPRKLTGRSEYVRDLRIGTQNVVVESFKHLLLPMWIGHYTVDGTEFEVTINGQTGEIVAERPTGLIGRMAAWLVGSGK